MNNNDTLTDRRIWLAVPHDEKETAVAGGGRGEDGQNHVQWDKESRLWYAKPGTPKKNISPWLPDSTATASGSADPREEFGQALQAAGLVLDGLPVMDGKIHRVATLEDKQGRKTGGAYKGFNDRRPGGWFINYHRADTDKEVTNWKATGGETDALTLLHIRAGARQAQDDSQKAREQTYATNTEKARSLYEKLPTANDDHPYLQTKGVNADPALRLTNNNALVMPIYDGDNHFRSLQYITPTGDKSLFKDAPKAGNFFITGGQVENGSPLLYAEGYATARSLHMASGLPVVVTIDAGNMRTIAGEMGTRYPDSPHIFMADLDHTKKVNKGLLMAQAAAENVPNGRVITPDFTEAEKARGLTDFNDLHQSRGLEAVSHFIATAMTSSTLERSAETAEKTMSNTVNDPVSPDTGPVAAPEPNTAPVEAHSIPNNTQEAHSVDKAQAPGATEPAAVQEPPAAVQAQVESQEQPTVKPEPSPTQEEHTASTKAEAEPVRKQKPEETPTPDEEDGFMFGPKSPASGTNAPDLTSSLIDTDKLLQRVTWEEGNGSVTYKVDDTRAFVDHGHRITMASQEPDKDPEHVMAALLTAIRHYGGKLEITGSDTFRAQAIDLIATHDLKVTLKNPIQQAMLDDARSRLQAVATDADTVHATPETPADVARRTDAPTQAPNSEPVSGQVIPPTNAAPGKPEDTAQKAAREGTEKQDRLDFSQGVKGQLLEHGHAPYNFDKKNNDSYYIRLRTQAGERTVWGVELESAIKQSRVSEMQVINVQHMGKKQVTIQKPEYDQAGHISGYTEAQAHRNIWAISPVVSANVRPHGSQTLGENLAVYDLNTFREVQGQLHSDTLKMAPKELPLTKDNLLWMRPDGRGTTDSGDALTAKRPAQDKNAGTPVMTSWNDDGRLALHLVKGHGNYLQGIALINEQYHHVLATLTGRNDSPRVLINALSPDGLKYVGHGRALNKVGSKETARDTLVFKLAGDPPDTTRLARLEMPGTMMPHIHTSLGFDKRYNPDASDPKQAPRAENHHKVQASPGRPG